jgi:ABC-2 type transport system ATP-binding protein
MRQRLGIADALVKEPSLLILDEPTIAIDPAGVAELLGLIRRLVDERGIAVLLASHLLEQVQSICDRVGIFIDGRLIAHGRVAELAGTILGGPAVIEVGVSGEAAGAGSIIAAVPGVNAVQADPLDPQRFIVTTDSDVRVPLVEALTRAGVPPVHLRRRGDELDAIYRRFVTRHAEEARERVH